MKRLNYLIIIFLLMLCMCDRKTDITQPSNVSNDWEVSTPQQQDFNSEALSNAFNVITQQDYINSVTIVRNGFLVADKYFNGYDQNDIYNYKGASINIISALIGIALENKIIDSLDQKIMEFFPEYNRLDLDPKIFDVTIKHLLTMKAGFDSERNNYSQIYYSDNWIGSTISLPLLSDPGADFRFNIFCAHLLSGIITKASGMSTLDYAKKYLFEPLNISVQYWERDPQNNYFGGNNMYLKPSDMAKLGLLYLNNGMFEEKRIIPVDWIEKSTTNYTSFDNLSWDGIHGINFGYMLWTGTMNHYNLIFTIGYGGQYVFLFPNLDLIIIITANPDVNGGHADWQELTIINIVANYILPSVYN